VSYIQLTSNKLDTIRETTRHPIDSKMDTIYFEPRHRNIIGISSAQRKDHRALGGLAFIPVSVVRRKRIL